MEELDIKAVAPQTQESLLQPSARSLPDVSEDETEEPSRGGRQLLREVAETILLTLMAFLVINTATGRFRIEGPSMEPNLFEGQYLIINKIVYKLHPPRRGDIIVFQHPRNAERDLIKRVVGLPGEAVEVREGQVYIDGTSLEEPYVSYGDRYSARYELGLDDFFVLGDNRPNSEDSRNWGVLKRDQIIGKAWISYWPPGEWGAVPHCSASEETAAQGQKAGADGY